MAYAHVPTLRGGYGGLGLYNNLPTADPNSNPGVNSMAAQGKTVGDQSKADAIAFAQAQLANYPTEASVVAQYNQYASYLNAIPNFKPSDLKDPKKAAALLKQALINYAKANGFPTSTAAAEQDLENYAASVAQSSGMPIPASLANIRSVADLKAAAVDIACTAFAMETGIDAKGIAICAEDLVSGKIDMAKCEKVGSMAGAIAGAAICQAFGIPAPIGAWIGGLIGGDIGGTVAEIFGLYDPDAAVRAEQAAFDSWAQATLAQAQQICATTRSGYWENFDQLIQNTELQWRTAEVKIGWKFELRWFGSVGFANPKNQPFLNSWNETTMTFSGPMKYSDTSSLYSQNTRASIIGHGPSTDYGTWQAGDPIYGCLFNYGCPYPVSGLAAPVGFERDVDAYFARGATWIPPANRNLRCSFPLPTGDEAFNAADKTAWLSQVYADLDHEQAAVTALQMLSVTVVGDLVKTAGSNAAEKAINDLLTKTASSLAAANASRTQSLSMAKTEGEILTTVLNYGMLILGAGLLTKTLMDRNRS